jgi:GH24 family phage-related lysozyme (muramidase)
MKISDKGLSLIKRFEGLYLQQYKCPAGYWTIGYGHLIARGEQIPLVVTEADADAWLQKDVGDAERAVGRLVRVAINQNQFDALVSFTFNLGAGALQRSTLRAKLNRGEYDDAASEFSRWTLAGGRRLPGLVKRRAAEKLMFMEAV